MAKKLEKGAEKLKYRCKYCFSSHIKSSVKVSVVDEHGAIDDQGRGWVGCVRAAGDVATPACRRRSPRRRRQCAERSPAFPGRQARLRDRELFESTDSGSAPVDAGVDRGGGTLSNGTTCTTGAMCGSGFCVDGVCCNTDCSALCHGCNLTGSRRHLRGLCGRQPVHARRLRLERPVGPVTHLRRHRHLRRRHPRKLWQLHLP
jgi:hypothetical protein